MHHEYGVAAIDSASRHRPDHSPLGRLRRAYVGNREREIARERLSLAIPDNASGLFEIANTLVLFAGLSRSRVKRSFTGVLVCYLHFWLRSSLSISLLCHWNSALSKGVLVRLSSI
jgi:hypothetical protein